METKKFKNITSYIRCEKNKENPYTIIPNYILEDRRLNASDVGILNYILYHSDTWSFHKCHLQTYAGLGRANFNNSFKRLTEYGYVKHVEFGKLHCWFINDNPQKTTFKQYYTDKKISEWKLKNSSLNDDAISFIFNKLFE